MNFLRTLIWFCGLCLLLSPQLEPTPALAWHYGSSGTAPATCPFGNSGIDGCGVSPGKFYAPAINTTTQPTAAQWSAFARQSSQVWSGNGCSPDPNHCQAFNLVGVNFGAGPNSSLATLTPISSWVNGTNGCTYYAIGGTVLPAGIRANWPHDSSNKALINVLACTGNGSSAGNPGNPYTISGWSFTDANNAQCAAIYDTDTTHYTNGTGTVTITGNQFINSSQCVNSCNQSGSAQSIVFTSPNYSIPTCSGGASVAIGFVTITQGVYTPFVVTNNYYDFLWDQVCCSLAALAGGAVNSTGLRADLTFEFNYIRHSTHNPLGITWLAGGETTCSISPTNTPSLGASWPFPGYNVLIKFNYLEGIGFYTGYGHGEFMNWGITPISTADASSTLSGTTLTTSSASLTIGSSIFDSGGVVNGGVIVTAGSGTSYTVTNPNAVSFSGSAIKAMFGNICQIQYAYNTVVIPKVSSAGGMTTVFYGFNTTITYATPGGQLEYWSSQNNTVVSNNVGGATNASVSLNIKLTGASDPTCAAITPYSNGNCLVVLGYGALTTGGTCPGDAAYISNQGPFIGDYGPNIGFNGFSYCNGSDQGVYWIGCGSPSGTYCPIIDWDVAAGTSTVSGGSLSGTTVTLLMPWTWRASTTGVAITGLNPSDWDTGSPFTISATTKGNSIAYTNASATSSTYVSGGTATYSGAVINSGNPLTNQTFFHGIVSAPLMEISHVGAQAIDVKNNFTDETGKAGGSAIAIGGGAVYCNSSASVTGNLNLITGGATSSNNTGSGC